MNPNRRSFLQFTLTAAAAAGATWFDVPQILAKSVKLSQARAASLKKYGSFPMGITSGKWDDSKNEIVLSGEYLGGATGEGAVHLDGDDKIEMTFTVQVADGTVLLDLEASAERSN